MLKMLSGQFSQAVRYSCIPAAVLVVSLSSGATPQTHKTAPQPTAKPFTKEALVGTWKKSNGLALIFAPDGTFTTSEGEGGVSHGPYVISGDTLELTYEPDGPPGDAPVPVLTYRVLFQGTRMLLFLIKQDYGSSHQVYIQDSNPRDHKIVMIENGVRKTATGGAETYTKRQ
jgi:hypothetical protein